MKTVDHGKTKNKCMCLPGVLGIANQEIQSQPKSKECSEKTKEVKFLKRKEEKCMRVVLNKM